VEKQNFLDIQNNVLFNKKTICQYVKDELLTKKENSVKTIDRIIFYFFNTNEEKLLVKGGGDNQRRGLLNCFN
jgi:hypothetical protein